MYGGIMERLDKFLTNAGVATRSQIKAILKTGRVQVNGKAVTLDGDVIGGKRRMVE